MPPMRVFPGECEAFPNDSFSLRFTDCHKIGGNKKDIGSALAEHVQTCLFIYDSLSVIY